MVDCKVPPNNLNLLHKDAREVPHTSNLHIQKVPLGRDGRPVCPRRSTVYGSSVPPGRQPASGTQGKPGSPSPSRRVVVDLDNWTLNQVGLSSTLLELEKALDNVSTKTMKKTHLMCMCPVWGFADFCRYHFPKGGEGGGGNMWTKNGKRGAIGVKNQGVQREILQKHTYVRLLTFRTNGNNKNVPSKVLSYSRT